MLDVNANIDKEQGKEQGMMNELTGMSRRLIKVGSRILKSGV